MSQQVYGLAGLVNLFPEPLKRTRAPTTSDSGFPIGITWVNTDAGTVYTLTSVTGGVSTWSLTSAGGDLDGLSADSGTDPVVPSSGVITMTGGDNISTVGGTNEMTFNLDAAITLATSVSSPLYTVAAATDLAITAATGQDIILKMGDSAGANKVSFVDLADAEVFAVDSNGVVVFTDITVVDLTATGNTQILGNNATASTVTIASGVGGNTVSINNAVNTSANVINLAAGAAAADSTVNILSGNGSAGTQTLNALTGTRAGALNLATGAAAHVVAVGSASAGAITVDTAAGISLDAATASNFTVTGAGADLTLASDGGSVKVNSTEDAAGAIALSANGGVSETITITAAQGTGVGSVELVSTAGGISVTAGLATDDAINLAASAGGVDIDGALQVNIASSQAAATAVVIGATDAAGGIDINAGTGGATLDTTGAISLDAATASNFTVTGATHDLTLSSVGGSVKINSTEDAGGAIALSANGGTTETIAITSAQGTGVASILLSSTAGGLSLLGGLASDDAINLTAAAGGVDIDGALQVNIASSEAAADAIVVSASAGGIDITAAGGAASDIDVTCTSGSVNLTGGEAVADAIVLSASSGGVDITAAGAGLDVDVLSSAGSVNVTGAEATATAVNIVASNAAGGVTIAAGTGNVNVSGNLVLSDVATQLIMNGGAATDFIGAATLTNGDVSVANTNIAATDRIFLTRTGAGASTALGMLTYTINAGVDFEIISLDPAAPGGGALATDQSVVAYFIVRQT